MIFRTMTLGGIFGPEYDARDADEAEAKAIAGGDKVLDVMDDLIVVED